MFSRKTRRLTFLLLILISAAVLGGFCLFFPAATATGPEETADAIVLLAGDRARRTATAADLYLDGRAQTIVVTNDGIFSSWSHKLERNLTEIEWTEEELVKRGVPRNRIVKLPFYQTGSVYDALAVRHYLETHPARRILLVTSDYHGRRALWIFYKVFSNDPVEITLASAPSPRLRRLQQSFLETAKLFVYLYRYHDPQQLPHITPSPGGG